MNTLDTRRLKTLGGLTATLFGVTTMFGLADIADSIDTTPKAAPAAAVVKQIDTPITAAKPDTTPAPDATTPAPADKPAPAPEKAPAPEATPAPVAGLDHTQMNNAKKIVDAAKSMGLGEDAQRIAIATAMQESNLHNLASTKIAESYQYSNGEGEGSDHDSVGLFQQRPNWGSTQELMTPETSARKFLQALTQVPGWQDMPLTNAAQTVQVSAYPDAYAKHEDRATQIVDALNK